MEALDLEWVWVSYVSHKLSAVVSGFWMAFHGSKLIATKTYVWEFLQITLLIKWSTLKVSKLKTFLSKKFSNEFNNIIDKMVHYKIFLFHKLVKYLKKSMIKTLIYRIYSWICISGNLYYWGCFLSPCILHWKISINEPVKLI